MISGQVLGEFFNAVTRRIARPLSRTEALSAMDRLWPLATVPIDAALVRDAIGIAAEAQLSSWDGLIVAAARAGGCDRLLTDDLNDGQVIAGVRVENPFA